MGRLALQIGILLFNGYLLVTFAGETAVMPAWQRYLCMLAAIVNLLSLAQDGLLKWLLPYWPLVEEIMDMMGRAPLLLMILNGLSMLILLAFIAGLLFGGGLTGAGAHLLAIFAPGLSFYYAYTRYNDGD